MKANEVLYWLSARREGTWRQFRQAVEELHYDDAEGCDNNGNSFPLHQELRLDFERLAHVEFFANGCRDGWRVCPPALAAHPMAGGMRAVLCGDRSLRFWERMLGAAEHIDHETVELPTAPTVLRVRVRGEVDLRDLAAKCALRFQPDAPLALVSHLPACRGPSHSCSPVELPQGADWGIHEFDPKALAWRKITRHEAAAARFGVLRFTIYFQKPRYFLKVRGNAYDTRRAVALYVHLSRHRRDLLHYDREKTSLSLPAACRPPRLLERALVLCSGLPASFDGQTDRLNYFDVPLDIARFAAQLLRQPLL